MEKLNGLPTTVEQRGCAIVGLRLRCKPGRPCHRGPTWFCALQTWDLVLTRSLLEVSCYELATYVDAYINECCLRMQVDPRMLAGATSPAALVAPAVSEAFFDELA